MADAFTIHPATPGDLGAVLELIRELADYEKLTDQVVATEQSLLEHLFGPRPFAEAIVARVGAAVVGYALFFHNYSTFLALPGLYLEDLYVKRAHRRNGMGRALLAEVARIAAERGCGRVEWSVLDWNAPAIDFYQRLGAELLPDWRICRVTGDGIAAMARNKGDD